MVGGPDGKTADSDRTISKVAPASGLSAIGDSICLRLAIGSSVSSQGPDPIAKPCCAGVHSEATDCRPDPIIRSSTANCRKSRLGSSVSDSILSETTTGRGGPIAIESRLSSLKAAAATGSQKVLSPKVPAAKPPSGLLTGSHSSRRSSRSLKLRRKAGWAICGYASATLTGSASASCSPSFDWGRTSPEKCSNGNRAGSRCQAPATKRSRAGIPAHSENSRETCTVTPHSHFVVDAPLPTIA